MLLSVPYSPAWCSYHPTVTGIDVWDGRIFLQFISADAMADFCPRSPYHSAQLPCFCNCHHLHHRQSTATWRQCVSMVVRTPSFTPPEVGSLILCGCSPSPRQSFTSPDVSPPPDSISRRLVNGGPGVLHSRWTSSYSTGSSIQQFSQDDSWRRRDILPH
jgi:hypothetical protein